MFAGIFRFRIKKGEFFISRGRSEEIDESPVFRGGTNAHPILFIGVDDLKSACDFG
jgi:hypothetical protein